MKCPDCGRRLPREPVLVVAHGDGYLEVFGERGVDVHIARVPHCPGAEGERLADDWLQHNLPPRYRALYWPGKRRATATAKPLLPSTISEAKQAQAILDGLNQLAEELAPTDAAPAEEATSWT